MLTVWLLSLVLLHAAHAVPYAHCNDSDYPVCLLESTSVATENECIDKCSSRLACQAVTWNGNGRLLPQELRSASVTRIGDGHPCIAKRDLRRLPGCDSWSERNMLRFDGGRLCDELSLWHRGRQCPSSVHGFTLALTRLADRIE